MTNNEVISLTDENIVPSYARFQVAIEKGKGATLWDFEGKKYIDFTSGIGVNSLGYGNQSWLDAINTQAAKLQHISNLFYTEPGALLAAQLVKRSGQKKVFFSNSGAEANEGAIKLARKYSFDKYGTGRSTIVSLKQSFHGRTISTLAATGQEVFHNYFFPFTEGFKYTPANDIEALCRGSQPRCLRPYDRARPGRGRSAAPGRCLRCRSTKAVQRKGYTAHNRRGANRHRPHRDPVLLPAVRDSP
jgi:acetylornithine/N-succinyldiaminopimelate aminotransferase